MRLRTNLPPPRKAVFADPEDPPPKPSPLAAIAAQGCRVSRLGLNPCQAKGRKHWGLGTQEPLLAVAAAPQARLDKIIRRAAALAATKTPPAKDHHVLARAWPPSFAMVRMYLPLADRAAFEQAFGASSACKQSRKGLMDWLLEEEKKRLAADARKRLETSRGGCASSAQLKQPAHAPLAALATLRPLGVALTPLVRACFAEAGDKRVRCDEVGPVVGVPDYDDLTPLVFADPQARKTPRKILASKQLPAQLRRITQRRATLAAAFLGRATKLTPPKAWLASGAKMPDLEIHVNPAALARFDAAFGLVQVFGALGGGSKEEVHRRFGIGVETALRTWRFQAASTDLLRDFRLIVHLRGPQTGLRLRWKLTPRGLKVLGPALKRLKGKELIGGDALFQALHKVVLPALTQAAPTKGILAKDTEVKELLQYLSPYGSLLLAARLWPDLLRTASGSAWLKKLAPSLKAAGYMFLYVTLQGDQLELKAKP